MPQQSKMTPIMPAKSNQNQPIRDTMVIIIIIIIIINK